MWKNFRATFIISLTNLADKKWWWELGPPATVYLALMTYKALSKHLPDINSLSLSGSPLNKTIIVFLQIRKLRLKEIK
jgi:hypothetical protein